MKGKKYKLRVVTGSAAVLAIWLTSCSSAIIQPAARSSDGTELTQSVQELTIQESQESIDYTESNVGSPMVTPQSAEETSDSPFASSTPAIPPPYLSDIEQLYEELYVQAAIQDLASRLQIPMDKISILNLVPVDWSDASLGCPIPGQDYAQVLTPGYQVTLLAKDHLYDYHTDIADRIVLCGEDGYPDFPPIPIPTDERIMDGDPWVPVD